MNNIETHVEAIRFSVSSSKLYVLHKGKSLTDTQEKLDRLDEVVKDAERALYGVVK